MIDKNAKIYVAGHQGLVGSAVFRRLQSDGFENILARSHGELDLTVQSDVADFFDAERPDYVIMCAARVGGIGYNIRYPVEMLCDNLAIQNNVIQNAWKTDVKKLLFLGSSCIYPRLCPQPMREEYLLTGLLEPTNEGYAIAKIAGIKLCEYYRQEYGADFFSIVPCNLYGLNDRYDLEYSHVLPSLILKFYSAVINGESQVVLWGSGKSRREFLFSDDLADACIYMLNNYSGDSFVNIGMGKDVSIAELAETIGWITGFTGSIVFDSNKPDGMPQKLLDVSRAEKLDWRYKTELKDGIKMTYDDFLKNRAMR